MHYSAIGSFTIIATLDNISKIGDKKEVKLNIWMYNQMSVGSFGHLAFKFPFNNLLMKPEFMRWNLQEKFLVDSCLKISDVPKRTRGGW